MCLRRRAVKLLKADLNLKKSKRKTVLKLFIQYGYQLCLTFELKNFQTKKAGIGKGVC
jgi:hypothetical protein